MKNKSLAELISIGQACGLDGYDLCVRPGYLVSPQNAAETLAITARILASAGLAVPMVTASLDLIWPDQPYVRPLLEAMDRADIRLLKLGYYPFDPLTQDYWQAVEKTRQALAGWEKLAETFQVKVCYHTHSRGFLGVNCASLMHLIAGFNPKYIGAFIDPVHLVIEGEEFSVGDAMVQKYLSIASVKDVLLRRTEIDGHSLVELEVVPCGTGMVNFNSVFSTLGRCGFTGPLTVHCEFEHASETEFSRLMQHEVAFTRSYRQAYLSR